MNFQNFYDQPERQQNKVNKSSKSKTANETAVIKNFPEPEGFSTELHLTFKEVTLILLKLFHEIEIEVMLTSSHKSSINLI